MGIISAGTDFQIRELSETLTYGAENSRRGRCTPVFIKA
jgi:hypothetical protein